MPQVIDPKKTLKAIFLIFHGFEEHNGISKKIQYQIKALKACGADVTVFYFEYDEQGNFTCYYTPKEENYQAVPYHSFGKGFGGKIRKRCQASVIKRFVEREKTDFVYMRSFHNANPFTIRMVEEFKRLGNTRVVMEIPTYPYDQEYVTRRMKLELAVDKLYRRRLASKLDAIVTFSNATEIFGQRTIRISNGIDFDAIPMKTHTNDTSRELHLIGVAEVHYWHGYDRLVRGLVEYYRHNPEYKVYFHIVGQLSGDREREEILTPIRENGLEPYVILHGPRHGAELDELFEKADFAIGSLARHRSGITDIKTLKNREYAARGFGFVYSEMDSDFEQMPYIFKVPADETPVNIDRLLAFQRSLVTTPGDIRQSIEPLSWKYQMQKVINAITDQK